MLLYTDLGRPRGATRLKRALVGKYIICNAWELRPPFIRTYYWFCSDTDANWAVVYNLYVDAKLCDLYTDCWGMGMAYGGLPFPDTNCRVSVVNKIRVIWNDQCRGNCRKRDWTIYHGPPLYQIYTFKLRTISRRIPGLASDSSCGVRGRGRAICLLYDGLLSGSSIDFLLLFMLLYITTFHLQWNLSVTTTSIIKSITCDFVSNVF